MKPDLLVRSAEGVLDPAIMNLAKNGLRIPGSLKLAALADYWSRQSIPAFLISNGDNEMFERLGTLNIATYRKLGQAKLNLVWTKELFEKVYEVRQNYQLRNKAQIAAAAIRVSQPDEIARTAAFDAFMTSLVSALDSLAGEVTLLLNLNYSIWNAHFTTLASYLRNWNMPTAPFHQSAFIKKMKVIIVDRFLSIGGRLADWFEQIVQYRNAASHRPHLLWQVWVVPLRGNKLRLEYYLVLNTFAKPSEIIPPSNAKEISANEGARIMGEFQEQTVEEYCDWAFKHVVSMVSKIYDVLVEVYKARANDPLLIINDHRVLLKRSVWQQPTRFRGLTR